MRVAVTGTPGTGKTTATERLAERRDDVDVVHLNAVIESEGLYESVDEERDSVVADLDALAAWVDDYATDADVVVLDSHLAHHLDADRVAVLRCAPETLADRLRERGESDAKAAENAESEALDVVLSEAVETHGLDAVYEIETTQSSPDAVADALAGVVDGTREPTAGDVDYLDYL
ncbi:adenylate kinase family protein [Haloarchaeobius iranensis]|uniref:Putative adenylate kinase n=1 Tax=Haloarchaeobius iranensis TaxID=996166 RepID=A0A1G9TRG8_9EURY|nr:adenylate kinase family protein [Haloarchaeobius iranensis]SDM50320.1 adenylate kinase [Haloarchaeobius iranensis]